MKKEHPILFSGEMVRAILNGRKTQTRRVVTQAKMQDATEDVIGLLWRAGEIRCPYGTRGDSLWVRETFAIWGQFQDGPAYCYRADGDKAGIMWKPSIHMPRKASRIMLSVERIRVERLQNITEDDAAAEGIERNSGPYILDFARLWDQINAKRGHTWSSDPWVWVVEFSLREESRK